MDEDTPPPAKPVKLKADGTLDGRGHAAGSKTTRFAAGDNRKRPGRPKGAVSLKTAYQRAAAMPVEYTDKNGKRHRTLTVDYVALKVREGAIKGEDKMVRRFEDRVEEYCPEPVDPRSTAKLLTEDVEILTRAMSRGVLPQIVNEDGGEPS